MNLFDFIPGYETHIYNDNKEPLLLLLIAFVLTFAFTRLYTRVARRRGWGSASSGGVHLHHMVIGVIMMAAAGLLSFTQFNYHEILYNIAAILFGGGLALTLDEFAMIFHLRDVYWAEEGRTSIDAILIGAAGAGAVLLMASPFTNAGEAKPVEKGAEDWAFDANDRQGANLVRPHARVRLRDHHPAEEEADHGDHRLPRPAGRDRLGLPARQAPLSLGEVVLPPGQGERTRGGAACAQARAKHVPLHRGADRPFRALVHRPHRRRARSAGGGNLAYGYVKPVRSTISGIVTNS